MHSLRLLLIVSAALCAWFKCTASADDSAGGHLVIEKLSDGRNYCQFRGEITQQSVKEVSTALTKGVCSNVIFLNSPGGDVDAAMAIGRLFRENQISVDVDDDELLAKTHKKGICASACVFIYVGAVLRIAETLGLHRPYAVDPSLGFADSNRRTKELQDRVISYFREMNISPALFDRMNVIPPHQIVWIQQPEIDRLIGQQDPAFMDSVASEWARNLGITPQEYYRRRGLSSDFCGTSLNLPAGAVIHGPADLQRLLSQQKSCDDCVVNSGAKKGCKAPH
jgi:hypothetical protein